MPEIWQQADTPRGVGDGRAGVDGGLGRVQRWRVCGDEDERGDAYVPRSPTAGEPDERSRWGGAAAARQSPTRSCEPPAFGRRADCARIARASAEIGQNWDKNAALAVSVIE